MKKKLVLFTVLLLAVLQFILLAYVIPEQPLIVTLSFILGNLLVLFISYRIVIIFYRQNFLRFLRLWQHMLFAILRTTFLGWLTYESILLLFSPINEKDNVIISVIILIPSLVLLLLDLSEKYRKQPLIKSEQSEYVTLKSESKNEKLSIRPDELLYIKSTHNYCEIWCEGDKIKKALIRVSLKKLEKQIQFDHILRCHRSYIVNLNQVKDYSGNSSVGMKLIFENVNEKIPVSKKYSNNVRLYLDESELPDRNFMKVSDNL